MTWSPDIPALVKLACENGIDELTVTPELVTIKKSKHAPAKPTEASEDEARRLLEQHTQPATDAEPWMQTPQGAVDRWAMEGK